MSASSWPGCSRPRKTRSSEADSEKVVFSGSFHVEKNGKSIEGYLPEPDKTTLWIIEWKINEEIHSNHYLAYQPVIALEQYMEWSHLLK